MGTEMCKVLQRPASTPSCILIWCCSKTAGADAGLAACFTKFGRAACSSACCRVGSAATKSESQHLDCEAFCAGACPVRSRNAFMKHVRPL